MRVRPFTLLAYHGGAHSLRATRGTARELRAEVCVCGAATRNIVCCRTLLPRALFIFHHALAGPWVSAFTPACMLTARVIAFTARPSLFQFLVILRALANLFPTLSPSPETECHSYVSHNKCQIQIVLCRARALACQHPHTIALTGCDQQRNIALPSPPYPPLAFSFRAQQCGDCCSH